MKIGVYCKSVTGFGGGVKYGLLFLQPLVGEHDVTIFQDANECVSGEMFKRIYGIAMEGLTFVPLNYEVAVPRITEAFDVFINITPFSIVESRAPVSLLIVFFPKPVDDAQPRERSASYLFERCCARLLQFVDRREPLLGAQSSSNLRARYGRAWVCRRFPLLALRSLAWRGWRDMRLGHPALDTYTHVVTISHYSALWVRKYYGRESVIVYPPIDIDSFAPAEKEQVVLSVGRFEPGEMSKKHEALLTVFRELHDSKIFAGWRMVICGGKVDHSESARYIERLQRDARGYPVAIEIDVSFDRLQSLYRTASLYWHAMGFGEDPERNPIRFEHFGMTTAEAMAAGCIPMAISAGGQAEIITHGKDGYLWNTLSELKTSVRHFLSADDATQKAMRVAARQRARDFSFPEFYRSARRVYNDVGIETSVGRP